MVLSGLLAGGAWAASSAVGSSPDEDFHLVSIWCGQGLREDVCEQGASTNTRMVPKILIYSACFAFDANLTARCQDDIKNPMGLQSTDRGSFNGLYPPVYFWTMSHFVTPNDVQATTLTIRMINVGLFVGIFSILLFSGRSAKRAGFFAWLLGLVPLGIFIVASVNPSAWAIIGLTGAVLALMEFFDADTAGRKVLFGLLYVLTGVMASGARFDAAIYLVIASIAVGILKFTASRLFFKNASIILVSLVFVWISWTTSSQGSVISGGLGAVPASPGRSQISLFIYNLTQIPQLIVGAFGSWGLGWLDTLMPALVWAFGFAAFCVAIFTGFRQSTLRGRLAIGLVAAALYLIPLYVLQRGGNLVGEQVQPRYLLPLMLILLVLSFSNPGGAQSSLKLRGTILLICILGLTNSLSLYFNERRYVVGAQSNQAWLTSTSSNWWWGSPELISPMATVLIGGLAFIVFFVSALQILRNQQIQTEGL